MDNLLRIMFAPGVYLVTWAMDGNRWEVMFTFDSDDRQYTSFIMTLVRSPPATFFKATIIVDGSD